jgi:hypothetical protein
MYPQSPYPTITVPNSRRSRTGLIVAILAATLVTGSCGLCGALTIIGSISYERERPTAVGTYVPPVAQERPATTAPSSPTPPRTTTPPPPPAMPSLVGKNAAIATDELKRLGVRPENVTYGSADPLYTVVLLPQNWTVVKQEPPAGTQLAPGEQIVLSCRKS